MCGSLLAWFLGLYLSGGYRKPDWSVTVEPMTLPNYNPGPVLEAIEREDYQSALEMALPYANAGNSVAQVTVAVLYEAGLGVGRDVIEAERWLIKAASQNDPVAWNNLGALYAVKHAELSHRWVDARRCYERAKELGVSAGEPYPPPTSE